MHAVYFHFLRVITTYTDARMYMSSNLRNRNHPVFNEQMHDRFKFLTFLAVSYAVRLRHLSPAKA